MTPSSTATGGTRGRCSWATSSARCTSDQHDVETITPGDLLLIATDTTANQVGHPLLRRRRGAKGYNDYWINETKLLDLPPPGTPPWRADD